MSGILRLVKVLGRVFVGRLIATTDMTTDQAQPQVHPPAAGLKAFLAAIGRAWADVLHVLEVVQAITDRILPSRPPPPLAS